MEMLNLPIVMVENIISYLNYDEIAKNRLVCKVFDDICQRMLNRGFVMIERRHALALKSVKTQLPRRESERRYHPLSRHCDILTSIETRISMLNMTYTKFIDTGLCCFIPGKVIDEIKRVLSIVETSKTPPRAHEVLQELRDISSMAIEHFDEKISPAFRKRLQDNVVPAVPRPSHTVLAPPAMRQELSNLRRVVTLNSRVSLTLVQQYKKFYGKMLQYRKVILRQRVAIKRLNKKQKEQDNTIADLKKRIEECDIKYSELTHTNQAVGGKAITTAPVPGGSSAGTLRHFGSQIKLDLSVLPIGTACRRSSRVLSNMKPRKFEIRLPTLSQDESEPPRKQLKLDNPTPTTSKQVPTDKRSPQNDIYKLRRLTNEIRQLSQDLKRPLIFPSCSPACKKVKRD